LKTSSREWILGRQSLSSKRLAVSNIHPINLLSMATERRTITHRDRCNENLEIGLLISRVSDILARSALSTLFRTMKTSPSPRLPLLSGPFSVFNDLLEAVVGHLEEGAFPSPSHPSEEEEEDHLCHLVGKVGWALVPQPTRQSGSQQCWPRLWSGAESRARSDRQEAFHS
jgi:hypothetical protein